MFLKKKLKACPHESTSITTKYGDLEVCFYCGSTHRLGEFDKKGRVIWIAPWLWRD